jgi:hypothetical protein
VVKIMLGRTAVLFTAAAALAGCAGMSEQACLVSDWRTVGFEDGTYGRPVGTIGSYRQACAKHGIAPDLESYRAGHAEGVEIYCRPSQGFDAGRSGASYHGVCPADLEPDFLDAYNSGRHLYELELALRSVDSQIASNQREQENIKNELTQIGASMVSSETTAEQRVLLVSRAADLGQRYGELTREIEGLREERVVHEIALRDYQQTLAARS